MERDKHGKFVELATKRVNKALDQIRLVGNLSNRMTYEYSEEEAKKILRALQKEIDTVKSKFGDFERGFGPQIHAIADRDRSSEAGCAQRAHGACTSARYQTRTVGAPTSILSEVEISATLAEVAWDAGHRVLSVACGDICPRVFLAWSSRMCPRYRPEDENRILDRKGREQSETGRRKGGTPSRAWLVRINCMAM